MIITPTGFRINEGVVLGERTDVKQTPPPLTKFLPVQPPSLPTQLHAAIVNTWANLQ